jgi:hypothetical protein
LFSAFDDGVVPVEFMGTAPTAESFLLPSDLSGLRDARISEGAKSAWTVFASVVGGVIASIAIAMSWEERDALRTILILALPIGAGIVSHRIVSESHRIRFGALDRYDQAVKYHHLHAQCRVRSYWESLDGHEFEHALANTLKLRGMPAYTTQASADGGVDVWTTRNGARFLIQCKKLAKPCGVAAIRDVAGARVLHRADFAIVASTSGFTKPAAYAARSLGVSLWSMPELMLLAEGKPLPAPLEG